MALSGGIPTATELAAEQRRSWLPAWGEFAHRLAFGDLPGAVMEHAKLVLLDTIGAIIAGMQEPEMKALVMRTELTGHSALIGGAQTGAPQQVALLNGTAGTMLEIDEGNQFARGHPAIQVLPALLAVAASERLSGQQLIRALVLGYEFGARLGAASKLNVAMHPHGTWGAPAAALAVAALREASQPSLVQTVNIGSSFALSTSRRTMLEGATVRNTYSGFSNLMGILASDFERSGFTGEADGVASVYSGIVADEFSPDVMLNGLGRDWEIARNYFKSHAACRYTHSALDALLQIMSDHAGRLVADAIEAIEVDTYIWAAQLNNSDPDNMLAAKFSLPFALATTIQHGEPNLNAFRADAIADPVTRKLSQKVRLREDVSMTAMLPDKRPSRVCVHLKTGEVLSAQTFTNRGDAESPYSRDDIILKFRKNVAPVWGEGACEAVIDDVMSIDQAKNLGALNEKLSL
ncbi:MmgE/PrpD family protein [Ponticaulis profundi]|uniref:MmgE/PrpD family protein n=1 Tax=Ponticaulis profundi TaxID=2665222 RepID=A0ABW1SAS2_9PROT